MNTYALNIIKLIYYKVYKSVAENNMARKSTRDIVVQSKQTCLRSKLIRNMTIRRADLQQEKLIKEIK